MKKLNELTTNPANATEPTTAPTLADIAKQIAENAQAIEELKNKEDKTRAEWDELTLDEKYSYIKTTPAEERIMREWTELETEIKRLENIALILRHNYRATLAAQVLPAFLEILKKYDGKKAGEKTREKMSNELITACGCLLGFDRNYNSQKSETAYISERYNGWRGGINFDINTKNRAAIIDEDNTINGKLTAEDLRTDAGEYIEDAAARVEAIAEADNRVKEAQKTYNAAVEARNALIVDGYDRIDGVYRI